MRDVIRQGEVDMGQFYSLAQAATQALAGFHRQDFCHRDISSGNILFNMETGPVAAVDLGSALEMPRQARPVINPRHVEGSRAYMSPEQTVHLYRPFRLKRPAPDSIPYSIPLSLYSLIGHSH